ncbi:hypothetical protein PO613_25865, partial [Streptomyces heilongjiangensis]|nr:hypothetical protein [Streptomyces heilongjiangensis]
MTALGMTEPGNTATGMTALGNTTPGMTVPGNTAVGMTRTGMAGPGIAASANTAAPARTRRKSRVNTHDSARPEPPPPRLTQAPEPVRAAERA